MPRYSAEEKAKALEMIRNTSIAQASKDLKISQATLHKWKQEVKKVAPSRPGRKGTAKASASEKSAVETAMELLNDDSASEKIRQLEAENVHLRDINSKLRKALTALIDGDES